MAALQPALSHYQGGSLTHTMLITAFSFLTQRSPGASNKVGSLSPVKRLVGFEPGTFQFWLQCLKPLGHSSPMSLKYYYANRAFSSGSLHAIIAHNHLPFFKVFSNFVHFCPNFQIFCPFLPLFNILCPFSEKLHACPYFLEWALVN